MNPTRWIAAALAAAIAALAAAPVAARAEGPPTAIVLDAGSATPGAEQLEIARNLAAARDGGALAVVAVADDVSVVLPPSRDDAAIADALTGLPARGAGTRALDGAAAAINLLAREGDGGRVIVFADAPDRGSRATAAAVTRRALASGLTISAVTLAPSAGKGALARLADATGGTVNDAATTGELLGAPAAEPATPRPAAPQVDGGGGTSPLLIVLALLLGAGSVALLVLRGRPDNSAAAHIAPWVEPLAEETVAVIPTNEADLPESARPGSLQERLEIGGSPKTVAQAFGKAAIIALPFALLALLLAGIIGLLVVAIMTPLVVRLNIARRVKRQRKLFANQLAETIQAVASAMRAGRGLSGALSMVAEDAPDPMQREVNRAIAAERLGVPLDDALEDIVRRMANRDMGHVAMVAALQREVGGNGAEALDRVVETVRGRDDLRRLVGTLTAQGRISRWVLTSLPIAIVGFILIINPDYLEPLFETGVGQGFIVMSVVLLMIGSFWMKRVVEIEV